MHKLLHAKLHQFKKSRATSPLAKFTTFLTTHKIALLLSLYFGAWFSYFLYFWMHSFVVNRTGGISAQHVNLWGDWAAHFTIGSAMAERGLLLTTSPFLLNAPFSYPFVADMLSAVLLRLNVEFFMAFILPSFVFSCLLIIALFLFYKQLSKSIAIALLASTLFLFNGGTGFLYYFEDIAQSSDKFTTALNPPRKYTNIEDQHYRWISVVNSMVFPQRAFTLGFPVALIILTILANNTAQRKPSVLSKLLWALSKKKQQLQSTDVLFFAAAAITGLMPIIHTHSFLALFVLLLCWSVGSVLTAKDAQQKKQAFIKWSLFALIVASIAIPLIYVFILNTVETSFMKWYPGWYVGNDYKDETLLSFWFKNWGIVPLLSLLGFGLLLEKSTQKLQSFFTYIPFFMLFALTNLVLFQPFVWDNTKILVWASLGFSFLAAYFLHSMWHENKALKILVVVITVFTCLSGFLDTYRAIRFKLHSYQMYSQEERVLAQWVTKNTDPNSIWLTGTYHNHWLFNLTGRQAVATYTGWLWTHGYDYHEEERDISLMFNSPQNSGGFEKYEVEYVVLGPFERKQYNSSSELFTNGFMEVQKTDNYTIFKRK